VTKKTYRNILVLIILTATTLIVAQVYYAIKNYQVNKQRFIQDVQLALDASIENYFAEKAKNNIYVLGFSSQDSITGGQMSADHYSMSDNIDSVLRVVTDSNFQVSGFKSIWTTSEQEDSIRLDSAIQVHNGKSITKYRFKHGLDSSRVKEFENLTQRVIISISEELIDLDKLYKGLAEEMGSKGLDIDFMLNQETEEGKSSAGVLETSNFLSAEAESVYIRDFNTLSIDFENATLVILKRGISELVLSFILIVLVISTLVYLYHTIYTQKQLATIKDDLVSNITHEFKTPIATIFSALEGVTNFNETNDQEKTKRYLSLSTDQLTKLNNMVEKLLETATIDKGKLSLTKDEVELVAWTNEIIERFQIIRGDKELVMETKLDTCVKMIDRFHLENALSNLIDNAIKYGGRKVSVRLYELDQQCVWEVEDDGGDIPKEHRDRIFDKLYRIPTGNQHDVKGFGIGLYYARAIAEQHDGSLALEISKNKTLFKLSI
jgi:two-component system phosphate regulon sensor histidine kinase PhoR